MKNSGSKSRPVHEARRPRGQPAPADAAAARQPETEAAAEASLRRAVVAACLALNRLGLNQGSSGNISVRCGADMLITPSAIRYEDLRPDMLARMTLDQAERPCVGPLRASSEWRLHRDILRARPQAGAVVHCHAPHATALSMLRRPLPAVHYMIASFGGGDVRCASYAPFGTQELSDLTVAALADRTAALLGNHGAVALGADLDDAMRNAQELEALARMYLLARAAGTPELLTPSEIEDAAARYACYRAVQSDPQADPAAPAS